MKKTISFISVLLISQIAFGLNNLTHSNDTTITAKTDTVKANQHKKTTKIRLGRLFNVDIVNDGSDIVVHRSHRKEHYSDYTNISNNGTEKVYGRERYRKFYPHWSGICLGVNNYTGKNFEAMPQGSEYLQLNTNKSMEFSLNLWQVGIPIVKHRLGIVTGVGFNWNNYRFRNTEVRLHSDSTILYHSINPTDQTVKSKLTVCYLKVPLLLELQIPVSSSNKLYISAGVEGELKINSHTKIKTSDKNKHKDWNDFHLNTFTLKPMVRLGCGEFGIYGSYNLIPLFDKNAAPELYNYSIGVTFNF